MQEVVVDIPFEVFDGEHGTRLDVFLSRRLRRLSRNRAAQIIKHGRVRFGDGTVVDKPSAKVTAGDRVLLQRRRIAEPPIDDIVVPILHEDDDLLAVNKPGDLVVHPTATLYNRTLIRVLRARRPGDYLTLLHRIDKETSGLILLGRNDRADVAMKADFRERRVKKSYLAIVVGSPRWDSLVVDEPLRLAPNSLSNVLMETGGDGAYHSVTELSVIARGRQAALVEARPLTGRQHQIRVHLRHIGHPIIGDKLYLGDEQLLFRSLETKLDRDTLTGIVGHWRQALHAWRVTFQHPGTRTETTLEAPLADDLLDLAARYGIVVP